MNGSVQRYGFAFLISALALLLTRLLMPLMEQDLFLFFFAAVMLSAWYGGLGPGILATVFAILSVNYFFITPLHSLAIGPGGLLRLGVFAFVALLTDTLTARQRRAEQAARAESARFQVTLRSIGDAVIVTDREGRITFMNPVAESLTGWTGAAAIGRDLAEVFRIVNATTGESLESPVTEVLQQGTIVGLANDTLLITRDGTRLPIDDSGAPIRDDQGTISGAVLIFRDITERKRIEEELRQSRDQLAIVLRDVADGITVQDPTGRLVYANDSAARSIGFPSGEALLSTPILEILTKFEVMDEAGQPFPLDRLPGRLALQGVRNPEALVRFRVRATGEERWSLVKATPVFDEQNRVQFAVNVWHDMTERRRAEIGQRFLLEASAVLAESLDYERTLDHIAQLAVPALADWCMIDLVEGDGIPQRLTAAHTDPTKQKLLEDMRRRYPTSPDAPHGYPRVIRTGQPELIPAIPESLVEAVAHTAEHRRMLRELGLKSNLCVPLIARSRILGAITFTMAESGRRFNAHDLALAQDLAGRAALALDNAWLYREAQTAVRARDEFLSIASHELKTPVAAVLAYADTLLRRAANVRPYTITERDERALQVIKAQTKRLGTLIDALLSVGRLQQGHFSAERDAMDICELVQQIVEEHQPLLERHTVELVCGTRTLIIDGDRERLEQVFQNLLQNAIKYSPDGGSIIVGVERQGDEVCISVTDQGIGIPREAQGRLFQPFYRAPMSGQNTIKGTGIGLYVVKEIVSLHGGTVEVESTEGKGSTFRVRLPLHKHSTSQIDGARPDQQLATLDD